MKVTFVAVMIGASEVKSCHTDIVYVQPIKEIKFLDDWKTQYANDKQGIQYQRKSNSKYLMGKESLKIYIFGVNTKSFCLIKVLVSP